MIPDRDLGAGGDKTLGDRASKTLRAAGDDGATAVQIDLVHGEDPFTCNLHRLLRLRKSAPSPRSCGERVGVRGCFRALDGQFARRLPLTRRFAIAEASLQRSPFVSTAAEGGLCSPPQAGRGEELQRPAAVDDMR